MMSVYYRENRKRYLKKPTMVRYTDSVPNHYGIKNYAPERVAGETDESIKNHRDHARHDVSNNGHTQFESPEKFDEFDIS